jgi:tetratricopeptide (TPR) repeat protein
MFLAGRELQRGADTAKAIAHLEAAKRCFPFHNGKDSPYLQLAGLFEATDPARALAEYEAFARVAAENYQVRSEKLKPAYLRREDWENLSRVCEEMVDISPFGANRDDPPDLALHRDWATALLALGRREEALRELEVQTLLVDRLPEEDRVGAGAVTDHLRLGRLLLEMGLADRALEEAMAALRLSPDDAEAIMLRTRAREAGGDR